MHRPPLSEQAAPPAEPGGTGAALSAQWAVVQPALNQLDDGLSVFDTDLRLVAWNRRFFELCDFPPEDFARIGKPFEDFIRYNARRGEYGPGDPEAQVTERIALAREMLPHRFERTRPDGTILEIRGKPVPGIGFVTIYKDITLTRLAERELTESREQLERRVEERTRELAELNRQLTREVAERKRALEALRKSEEWVRLVADTVPVLIGYVDREQRYQFANQRFEEWFGRSREEILGSRPKEVVGPELSAITRDKVRQALAGRTVEQEFRHRLPDGRAIDVHTSFVPRIAEDGAVLGYFLLAQDVTERRQAEALLRQAQKMKAVGQLTGGLAHDFNNLLTVIIGNLNLLRDQFGTDETIEPLVEPALGAARRGANLVRHLLAFSRRQPLQPRITDVNLLLSGMTELLQRSLGANVAIEVALSPTPCWVVADPNQMENALLNLAINARDAMPDGGRLRIAVERRALGEAELAGAPEMRPGDCVQLSVSDSGSGMAPEVMERAFEPFFTTKGPGRGSGLGLSMVYGFVRQSGGQIAIESEAGRGTTLRLLLPLSDAEPAVAAPGVEEAEPPGGSERVLVVEDDPHVRGYAVTLLSALGYAVREAEDGEAALALLGEGGEADLVLTDVVMPKGPNGIELARRVRELRPDTRLLFMSGYPDEVIARDTALARNLDFIAKPFEKRDLAQAVRDVLDRPR